MKFFSEKTRKMYDDVEALEAAEKEFSEKEAAELALKEERKARYQEVEDAYKHYLKLKSDFIKDFKNFHMTLTEADLPDTPFISLFDRFFNW